MLMSLNEIIKNMERKTTLLDKKDNSELEITFVKTVSWPIVFFSMLTLSIIIALIGKYYYEYLKTLKMYNKISMKFLEIFLYAFVINLFILTFSTSNYVARVKKNGIPGPIGDKGVKGMRGKDVKCNICTKKYNTIKRDKPKKETMFVENISQLLEETDVIPTGWNQSKIDTTDMRFDLERSVQFKDDIKYLIGIIVSYNNKKQFIETIQFIKMNNMNYQELLGGSPQGKPITPETQQINFTCPNNYAITKIIVNLGYDGDKKVYIIRGLELGYSHIKTGQPNKEVFTIGNKSTQSNIISVPYYAGFKQHNNKDFPSFINGIAILSNNEFVENIMVTHINTYWD